MKRGRTLGISNILRYRVSKLVYLKRFQVILKSLHVCHKEYHNNDRIPGADVESKILFHPCYKCESKIGPINKWYGIHDSKNWEEAEINASTSPNIRFGLFITLECRENTHDSFLMCLVNTIHRGLIARGAMCQLLFLKMDEFHVLFLHGSIFLGAGRNWCHCGKLMGFSILQQSNRE
jgi:hypothetical protein